MKTQGWAWVAAGPLGGAVAAAACSGLGGAVMITVAVTVCVAWWWMTEAVEVPIASLVPLSVFPLLGVLTPGQVAAAYGNELVLLLAGGFMLSGALEHSGAHRRLAAALLALVGGSSGRRVLLAFCAASALISMWTSNTATTLMMLPVAQAVLTHYPDRRLRVPLVLGVAYSASVGGLGTPIGSPPNLVFVKVWAEATGESLGFLTWMRWGVPVVVLMTAGVVGWLGRGLDGAPAASLPPAGPWTPVERRVLTGFGLVALAWVTRTEPFGGWAGALGLTTANDASVALAGVVALALTPDGRGGRLLDWSRAGAIPWGTLLLFGGGLAIAQAFEVTGLSDRLAAGLGGLDGLPLPVLVAVIAAGVTVLSEIASNTAAAVLLMPVLAATAASLGVPPERLMLPGVLAASCGFMLPVATAANAIAHGTGEVTAREMMREGAVIDLIGVVVVTVVATLALG